VFFREAAFAEGVIPLSPPCLPPVTGKIAGIVVPPLPPVESSMFG